MRTTEIKLGNYFFYDKRLVFIAEILKGNGVTVYDGSGFDKSLPFECLKPIKLTEQLFIEKLGFFYLIEPKHFDIRKQISYMNTITSEEKSKNAIGLYKDKFTLSFFNSERNLFKIPNRYVENLIIDPIAYLHQLQNIFYYTQNEELIEIGTLNLY